MSQEFEPYWIRASIQKHFEQKLDTFVQMEGYTRQTEDLREWFELRPDLISCRRITKTQRRYVYDIDLACVVEAAFPNKMRLEQMVGEALNKAYTYSIPVYRLGNVAVNPLFDGTHIGCLEEEKEQDRQVDTLKNNQIHQSSISVRYVITLGGNDG